jgi:hypothetical protein
MIAWVGQHILHGIEVVGNDWEERERVHRECGLVVAKQE